MGKFEQAVALEERSRLLAYLHGADNLCGFRTVCITWRHLIELHLAGNAFCCTREAAREDLEQVLWRLNPAFRRQSGHMPNVDIDSILQGAKRPSRLASFIQRWLIVTRVGRVALPVAEREVRQRLSDAFLDRPATQGEDVAVSPLLAVPTWFDYVTGEFAMWGHSRNAVLDYSVAWTFQVLRVKGIMAGRAEAYIAPSAALYKYRDQ